MLIRKAYKFRLKPTAQQADLLGRFAGCCRLVWNKAVALQKEQLDKQNGILGYAAICKRLLEWKQEQDFLYEVHSQPLQQVLKDLSRAFKDKFDGTKGFPKFKRRGRHDSFRYPQGTKLDGAKVYLPKIGWVAFRKSQDVEGQVKNVTVSKSLGKWYVSIQVEMEVPDAIHPSETIVGIDMGVAQFATLSDGTVVKPVNSFRKWEKKLSHEQRKLSQKQKDSNNWKKQKLKIQRIHTKIARVRKDFLHKVTTTISKNHAVVVIEELKVKNMSASAKGTVESPGKNVRAKGGLNKSILDQGWFEFKRQLEYKQFWRGGQVIQISPVNTSRKCFMCHHVARENRTSQSEFECVKCHHKENADLNAAKNILAAGRAVFACGVRQFAV